MSTEVHDCAFITADDWRYHKTFTAQGSLATDHGVCAVCERLGPEAVGGSTPISLHPTT